MPPLPSASFVVSLLTTCKCFTVAKLMAVPKASVRLVRSMVVGVVVTVYEEKNIFVTSVLLRVRT